MSTGGGGSDDERSEFRRALRDAKPLRGGARRPPPVRAPSRPVPPEAEPVRFEVTRSGEHVKGRAPGTDRKRLARLARGEPAPEARIDLHRLGAEAARRALAEALDAAWREGLRCVLVVHGRGLHSEGGPVIKERLPGWLAEPPHGPRILGFASAPAGLGGPGATAVLLRRKR